jgi:uncharacterized protein
VSPSTKEILQHSSSFIIREHKVNLMSLPKPIVSAELLTIPLENEKHLIYAPLRQAAFVASAQVINFLADLQEGKYNQAIDPDGSLVKFLQQLEILDASSVETLPVSTFAGPPLPTAVTLFLTTACNLRCTYCYAAAGDTPVKSMSLAVAKRGIDFVVANAVSQNVLQIEIAYHGGGEPTANWQVMTGSFAYAQQKAVEAGLSVSASTATNGVLNDEQIDWIIANLAGVSLSFDGLPSVQDTHRITVSGKGSSDRVIHTIRRFDEAGFNYGIRVTVTHDQIASLPDSIEFICANFHPKRIQVEPAYQLGRWVGTPSAETEGFIAAFREAQGRAMQHGHHIYYSGARVGLLTNHFCGVTQDSFALTPDGNVSACYEAFSEDNPFADLFFYGKPDPQGTGYTFDLSALGNLRQQAVQHREFCQGCFAKWHCAGDCFHKSLTVNGRGEFEGSERCTITRELTKDQILARIAAAGGVFWHEPPVYASEQTSSASQGKEILR